MVIGFSLLFLSFIYFYPSSSDPIWTAPHPPFLFSQSTTVRPCAPTSETRRASSSPAQPAPTPALLPDAAASCPAACRPARHPHDDALLPPRRYCSGCGRRRRRRGRRWRRHGLRSRHRGRPPSPASRSCTRVGLLRQELELHASDEEEHQVGGSNI
jgi:hypothetical protein